MKKQLVVVAACVVLALMFAGGTYLYRQQRIEKLGFMATNNAATFVRPYSQTLGNEDARVYLVEFSDPACETCASFHPFVKTLMAENPGRIKLVMRYAPFHTGSGVIVKVLEAARKQDKFWEALEVMYGTQGIWASHHDPAPERLWHLLPRAGLDMDRLGEDMRDPEIDRRIRQDLEDVNTLGVRKTPGFFVNGKPLEPFGSQRLRELVEAEIRVQYR